VPVLKKSSIVDYITKVERKKVKCCCNSSLARERCLGETEESTKPKKWFN
jgi:hypothetical protein